MELQFELHGQGEPVLLVHGLFSSRRVWRHIVGPLAAVRQVILVDLPGHGTSPCLDTPAPRPADFALELVRLLQRLGHEAVHLVGHSLGGWVTLEMAKLGAARSVTALCPAGLWPTTTAMLARLSLAAGAQAARLSPRPRGMPGPLLAQLDRITPQLARKAARHYFGEPDMRLLVRAILSDRFRGGQTIPSPVTVAQGARDWLLAPMRANRRDQLPLHTSWTVLPACGHIPMYDNPRLVTDLILTSTAKPRQTAPLTQPQQDSNHTLY